MCTCEIIRILNKFKYIYEIKTNKQNFWNIDFFLFVDGNKLKENSADASDRSLDSKKSENEDTDEEFELCQENSSMISE